MPSLTFAQWKTLSANPYLPAHSLRERQLAAWASYITQTSPPLLFNPITNVSWDSVYWASDPNWANPGNGGSVTSWRDAGALNVPLIGIPTYPTFTAADPNLNNRPSVAFGASTNYLQSSGAPAKPQPGTVFAVFYFDGTGAAIRGLFDGVSAQRWFWRIRDATSNQDLYASTTQTFGTSLTAGPYYATITFNRTASSVSVNNGVPVTAPGDVGPNVLGDICLSGYTNQSLYGMNGSIAFIGFKGSGGLSAGAVANLVLWARSYYNFP